MKFRPSFRARARNQIFNHDRYIKEKRWECKSCKADLHRDRNASFNILRAGASAHGLGDVRPSLMAVSV